MPRKKRGAGEGGKGQRKDGLYYGSVTLPNGKRQYVYAKNARLRDERLLEKQIKVSRGEVQPKRQSVAEYLEWWLTNHVDHSPDLEPSTIGVYQREVRIRLIPALGKRQLTQLTPQHVQAMLADLSGTLSPKSIQRTRGVLRQALQLAQRYELVNRNVATLTDPPRIRTEPVQPYSPQEARTLLIAVQGDRLAALYAVSIGVGLRQGEALGLRWEDVNLETGVLTIRRQLQRQKGEWVLKAVKSQAGAAG